MAGKIRRMPATMYLNKESNGQYLNYSTESCSKKERKKENKYMLATAFITEYGYTQANTSKH
jgi:hypothetical protein